MKATKITYSRLVSMGNFENATVEIELATEKGDKALDVFTAAKTFVDRRVKELTTKDFVLEGAKKVLEDVRNHTIAQVEDAQKIIDNVVPQRDEDLPF